MFYVRKYANKMLNIVYTIHNNLYLFYIRQTIYRAKKPKELVILLQNIVRASNNRSITTDELCTILIECFNKYPLTHGELQKLSLWQQLHEPDLDIYNYTTTVFWLCTIQFIQELEQRLLY